MHESKKKRATLIVAEDIQQAKTIYKLLRAQYGIRQLKLYTQNNKGQEDLIASVSPGDIIVATNLAGRGTNINTDAVEIYGGLHTIIASNPRNRRIELQAIGRTARQGKRGTAEVIVNTSKLGKAVKTQKEYEKYRDKLEAEILDSFAKGEVSAILLKEKLFRRFNSLQKQLRQEIRAKKTKSRKALDVAKAVSDGVGITSATYTPTMMERNLLMAVEERWALFLKSVDKEIREVSIIDKPLQDAIEARYKTFEKMLKQDFASNNLIQNPYYHIAIANSKLMESEWFDNSEDTALSHLNKSVK